jgi:hypothetical protein
VRRDVGQPVEAVVALGVGVDDPRALQEGVVQQRLGEDRLAGAQRADGEDRRRAVGVRALAQVEQDGLARPVSVWPRYRPRREPTSWPAVGIPPDKAAQAVTVRRRAKDLAGVVLWVAADHLAGDAPVGRPGRTSP